MQWDPVRTVQSALWITGGQWAGKTTVSGILAERHGLTHYHYDYHQAKGHEDRRMMAKIRRGEAFAERDWEAIWIKPTPAEMVPVVLADFAEGFPWVLDDLRGIISPVPVIADGWGLRPELVVPLTGAPERMLVMVPTDEFRLYQLAHLPRAGTLHAPVSDPERGQRNRIERDRLLVQDAVRKAHEYGVRVIEVDGRQGPDEVADLVAGHFAAFLPN
jgi:hypothetical protein